MTRNAFKAAGCDTKRLKYGVWSMRLVSVALPLFLVLSASGITSDSNPYRGIVDRNVFSLKEIPPPPPPPDPNANKPPPPPLTLTGITTILGSKRAFFTINLPGHKPGEPAKLTSLMLSEGQRDGEVEVIRIDEKVKSVLVKNYGIETNLTFESHDTKGGSSAGGTGTVATHTTMPAHNIFSPGGGVRSIPSRNLRLGGAMPAPAPQNSGVNSQPFTPGSGASEGLNGMFTPGSPIPQQAQTQPQLTPAQQEILTEAAYQAALAKKDPSSSIFPPSYLDPKRNVAPAPPGPNAPGVPNQGLRPPGSF